MCSHCLSRLFVQYDHLVITFNTSSTHFLQRVHFQYESFGDFETKRNKNDWKRKEWMQERTDVFHESDQFILTRALRKIAKEKQTKQNNILL